jgi:PAS domain S-box-containing protein
MICCAALTNYSHQINENRRKNGERVWVVWSNRAYRDKCGKVTDILCVGNDITDRKAFEAVLEAARVQLTTKIQKQNTRLKKEVAERKKAQEALAETLDRYRLFSEISTEGILFHDNGIAIEVNDAFADLTECPRDQLIGMNVIDHFVSPGDRKRVRQNIDSNADGVLEINIRASSGRLFPAELRARSRTTGWPALPGGQCKGHHQPQENGTPVDPVTEDGGGGDLGRRYCS